MTRLPALVQVSHLHSPSCLLFRDAGFQTIEQHHVPLLLQLEELCCYSGAELLPYSHVLIASLSRVFAPGLPRRLPDLMKKLWCKLNTVMPRK